MPLPLLLLAPLIVKGAAIVAAKSAVAVAAKSAAAVAAKSAAAAAAKSAAAAAAKSAAAKSAAAAAAKSATATAAKSATAQSVMLGVVKIATATMVGGAIGYMACKVVDHFAKNIATKKGYTRFFVEVFKISWKTVGMVAKTLGGTTIDTGTASSTDFSTFVQNQLDDGPINYEYSY